jgi:iron complex transport system permease protein
VTTAPAALEASSVVAVRRPRRLRVVWLLALLGVLVVALTLSLVIGTRSVSIADVWAALGGASDGFDRASVAKRVPRTLLAAVAGAALAVSGAVMQGVTRNPLADPGILGINTGASLAVVAGLAFFGLSAATSVVWVAISGAALTAVVVYTIGSMGRGGATPLKLALAGAATSAALASFITAIALPRGDIAANIRSWQIGGVGGGTFSSLGQVLPFLAAGLVVSLLSAKALNSLALGDDLAAGLGERVAVARGAAALGAVVLCGAATAVTGPIGFVGLVVPHAVRLLTGVDHRWLLPYSAVGGAVLLTVSDVIGRVVARPAEIDVGIVTALIGAPFFIWIVRRSKVRAL